MTFNMHVYMCVCVCFDSACMSKEG